MTQKPFKSINEQIEILKERNLVFSDEEAAKENLSRYGYYEIINGYKQPFLKAPYNDNEEFKPKTNFEHLYDLYDLDKNIRAGLMASLEDFEQFFKQAVAYAVSEKISDDQKKYLAKSHYNTGSTKKKTKKSDRDTLLFTCNRIITKNCNEPFKHYREDLHNIPPWILCKGLTFGKAIYWYKLSKPDIRNAVISKLLGLDVASLEECSFLKINQFIGDVIDIYLNYRNLAAHNGRVYDHRSKKHIMRNSPFIYNLGVSPDDLGNSQDNDEQKRKINLSKTQFSNGVCRSSLGLVLYTMQFFSNKNPQKILRDNLEFYLKKYLSEYPEDKDFLFDAMEFNNPSFSDLINL